MTTVDQRRKACNYETNVPRCATCKRVLKPRQYLLANTPVLGQWHCTLWHFDVRPNACCDKWKNKKGEVVA
jgi:hypothetical protein